LIFTKNVLCLKEKDIEKDIIKPADKLHFYYRIA